MSIWTNKGRLFAAVSLCALTACIDPVAQLIPAPQSQKVLSGAVTVAAPAGYCVDTRAGSQGADSAIVLMGRCAGKTRAPAILTAAVAEAGSGQGMNADAGPELNAFFRSKPGRAALSASGKAENVQILEAIGTKDAFLIHLNDSSPNAQDPTQTDSWRAVLPIKGRLVTLSVAGTQANPMTPTAGRALLVGFVASMRKANP